MNRHDHFTNSFGGVDARSLAGIDASSADPEMNLVRRSLIESMDTLFGHDVEWAAMEIGVADGTFTIENMGEPAGATAAMFSVVVAAVAAWPGGNGVNRSKELRKE